MPARLETMPLTPKLGAEFSCRFRWTPGSLALRETAARDERL